MSETQKYPCLCCGYKTKTMAKQGNYEICNVCGWEDDYDAYFSPDATGGPNRISLNEARANFSRIGVASEEAKVTLAGILRPPRPDEI